MRKVFLDDLPRHNGGEGNGRGKKGTINWGECVGYTVPFIYDNITGHITIEKYDVNTRSLYIKYLDESVFTLKTPEFLKCKLGRLLGKYTDKFKVEVGTNLKDANRDLIITNQKYIYKSGKKYKYYNYKCNICGFDNGEASEVNLLKHKSGCGCCDGKIAVLGINTIWDTDRWMCDLGVSEEDAKTHTRASGYKVKPVCKDCGRIKDKAISLGSIYREKSIGCYCSDKISIPNKIMFGILEQLNINFITEYSPKWISPKRYDFYFKINNEEYIIEMDGIQHKKDSSFKSNWISLDEQLKIDEYKNNMAKINKIKIIRIDCEFSDINFIKENIFKSELINILDLNRIKWDKIEEITLKNITKEICELWNNNNDIENISKITHMNKYVVMENLKRGSNFGWCDYVTISQKKNKQIVKASHLWNYGKNTSEISKIMNINIQVVRSYLKKGNVLKLCNYDPDKSIKRKIAIYKNDILLGEYNSVIELTKEYKKIYDVDFNYSKVCAVARGERLHHKGFTFKYAYDVDQPTTQQQSQI